MAVTAIAPADLEIGAPVFALTRRYCRDAPDPDRLGCCCLTALLRDVEEEARRRGVAKSALVRQCVEGALRGKNTKRQITALDLVADLVGSQPGPRDASSNRRRRGHKNSR